MTEGLVEYMARAKELDQAPVRGPSSWSQISKVWAVPQTAILDCGGMDRTESSTVRLWRF